MRSQPRTWRSVGHKVKARYYEQRPLAQTRARPRHPTPFETLSCPTGHCTQGDCTAWCASEHTRSCHVRVLLLRLYQTRCGYDAGPAQCVLFVAKDLDALLVDGLASQQVQVKHCSVKLTGVTLCDPTPAVACENSLVSLEQARAVCAGVSAAMLDECVFDYCGTGGDPSVVNSTFTIEAIDVIESTNRPPMGPPLRLSPPPAPLNFQPPQCIIDPEDGAKVTPPLAHPQPQRQTRPHLIHTSSPSTSQPTCWSAGVPCLARGAKRQRWC